MGKLACALLVIAIGCKSSDKPAPAPTPAAPAGSGSAVAPVPKPAPKAKTALTKAQLAELRKVVKKAWKAQGEKRWSDAVTGFDAALKINAGDPRLLTEAGWSAMNAGDYVKAKRADEQAIHAATDPKVKAAGLYNLGLVQEKLGDNAGAAASFATSLVLRPNATVQAERAKVGTPPEATDVAPCPKGKSACYCAVASIYSSPSDEDVAACHPSTETKSPVPGWQVVTVAADHGTTEELVDEHGQVVMAIGNNDDRMRHSEAIMLDKAEVKTVGGHKIVWLQTTDSDLTQTMFEQDITTDSYDITTVTICTLGDAKTPTRCGLRDVPTSTSHSIDHEKMLDDGTTKEGKHELVATELAITIADDGTATVKLASGSASELAPNVLGPHKLW